MKKFYSFIVALLMVSATASAQFVNSQGGRKSNVGSTADVESVFNTFDFTYSPMTLKSVYKYDGSSSSSTEDLNAVSLGWTQARSILSTLPLYIQYGAGLQYAWKTDKESESGVEVKSTTSFLTLKVPVNVLYNFNIPNVPVAIMPYAGLGLHAHLLGQNKYTASYDGETETEKESFFNEDDMAGEPLNRIVLGWQIGAKVAFKNLLFGVAYEGPVTNLYKYSEDGASVKFNYSQVNISLGIKF